MHEEIPPVGSKTLEKAARPDPMSLKALELAHRPSQKRLIDVSQQGGQRRWRVSPVVGNPAPKERIDPPGDVGQRKLRLSAKVQVPNRSPHGLQGRNADRGIEAAEQRIVPQTPHQTGPKAIPEEVKLDIRIAALTLAVLGSKRFWFWSDATPGRTLPSGLEARP